MELKKVRLEI